MRGGLKASPLPEFPVHWYQAYGLRLASDIELPETQDRSTRKSFLDRALGRGMPSTNISQSIKQLTVVGGKNNDL